MSEAEIIITPVAGKAGRAAFVDLGRKFAAATPHSVPQLRAEQMELLDPDKNPFFQHAEAQLFIAERGGKPVGRISAQIDHIALEMKAEQGFGPGVGFWGYFDAEDEQASAALIAAAENWLRQHGMTRALGPVSMSIWEEPGLLVRGHDHSPMILMGHHPAHYRDWVESAGYTPAKSLLTYDLDIVPEFPPIVQRIVKSGLRNDRLTMRKPDPRNLDREWRDVLAILNDAWSDNWGFVPFTEAEIAYAAKKMKPIIHADLNRIIDLDGEPVAFMIVFPDMNDMLAKIDGKLLPFGWARLLWWLKRPRGSGVRVPLMGVLKKHQNSRLASQLAFMMIADIRKDALQTYKATRAEIGWILDDNKGMVAIADTIGSEINREYLIFGKDL